MDAPPREKFDIPLGFEAPSDVETPQDEAEQVTDAEDFDEEDAQPTEAGDRSQEPAKPRHSAHEWANVLMTAEQRINEVPVKMRAEVLTIWKGLLLQAQAHAERQGVQKGYQTATQDAELKALVDRIDALKRDDPEGYVEWEQAEPRQFQAYLAARSRLSAPNTRGVSEAEIAAAAADVCDAAYAEYPSVKEAIVAIAAVNPYPSTAQGLARLTRDVEREVAKAKAAVDAPDKAAAAERAAKAREHANRPKGAAPTGNLAVGELTLDMIRRMSADELRARPDWRKDVDKALARSR
jgi:hypothetical protein